jgi:hypothetical protein
MSPENQPPDFENPNSEIAFVQRALEAADRSERSSRIIVGVLAILALVAFIWMHLHMFPLETLGGLLYSLLRVDLFFLVLLFAITMYLRQVMNKNTRTILRAPQNTRQLYVPRSRRGARRAPRFSLYFQFIHIDRRAWIGDRISIPPKLVQ